MIKFCTKFAILAKSNNPRQNYRDFNMSIYQYASWRNKGL